jgi:hypothetical protein
MDSALLLHALDDPLMRQLDLSTGRGLRHLKNIILVRNHSVLAHGTETIDPKLGKQLGELALRSLRAFWRLEFDGEDVHDRIADLAFLVDI